MNKNRMIQNMYQNHKADRLIKDKHNPWLLGDESFKSTSDRSVICYELSFSDNFMDMVTYEKPHIVHYNDKNHMHSSRHFIVIKTPIHLVGVPASGVAANSLVATSTLDRIVAVWGYEDGIHIYGENQSVIDQKVLNGELILRHIW